MERPKSRVVWDLIYPFLVYEACVLFGQELLVKVFRLSWAFGLAGQAVSTVFATVILWYRFVFKEKMELSKQHDFRKLIKGTLMAIAATVISGVGWNLFVLSIQVLRRQEQFQTANEYFYGSSLWVELVTLGVITPIAEELLFRGIIYKKLRELSGTFAAVMLSAVFFGVYHLNLTQMIYAGVLGIILALLMEVYKDIRIPMVGHMAVNIVVVLNGELGILDRTILATPLGKTVCMISCLAGMVVFAAVLGKKCKE